MPKQRARAEISALSKTQGTEVGNMNKIFLTQQTMEALERASYGSWVKRGVRQADGTWEIEVDNEVLKNLQPDPEATIRRMLGLPNTNG